MTVESDLDRQIEKVRSFSSPRLSRVVASLRADNGAGGGSFVRKSEGDPVERGQYS